MAWPPLPTHACTPAMLAAGGSSTVAVNSTAPTAGDVHASPAPPPAPLSLLTTAELHMCARCCNKKEQQKRDGKQSPWHTHRQVLQHQSLTDACPLSSILAQALGTRSCRGKQQCDVLIVRSDGWEGLFNLCCENEGAAAQAAGRWLAVADVSRRPTLRHSWRLEENRIKRQETRASKGTKTQCGAIKEVQVCSAALCSVVAVGLRSDEGGGAARSKQAGWYCVRKEQRIDA